MYTCASCAPNALHLHTCNCINNKRHRCKSAQIKNKMAKRIKQTDKRNKKCKELLKIIPWSTLHVSLGGVLLKQQKR